MQNLSSYSAFRVLKYESGSVTGERKYAILYDGNSAEQAFEIYSQFFRESGHGVYELHAFKSGVWELVSKFYWSF